MHYLQYRIIIFRRKYLQIAPSNRNWDSDLFSFGLGLDDPNLVLLIPSGEWGVKAHLIAMIISAQLIIKIVRKNSFYEEVDVAFNNCLIYAAS